MSRVLLSKEIQINLCLSAKQKINTSWRGLARYLGVNHSTLENWYRGNRLIPEEVYKKLATISGVTVKSLKLLPDNWGSVKGGQKRTELYGKYFGSLAGRRKGALNANKNRIRSFITPAFSNKLAEFVGIMLGDGGISRTQISVTLGFSTDKDYVPIVINLIKSLFPAKVSVYRPQNKDAIRIRSSGINLTKSLLEVGLVVGNKIKQQFDIPAWIEQEESFIKACIRGMVDTDGCVHRKVRREKNGIEYRSIGITFCSHSEPLQFSLIRLFNKIGFKVAISGPTIYLCGKEQVLRYVEEIGFSNPKHRGRFEAFLKSYGWVKVKSENCFSPAASV